MKYYTLLIATFFIFSCGKEKIIQLPEITHSDITEINDVSVAYLFYDETTIDSVELNKGNLISTTNWLVNVDSRLTLKQTIPHIKFLQKKKSSSSHKNKNAKNYFTCFDTNKKNLGFIEFTDVVYHEKSSVADVSNNSDFEVSKKIKINFNNSDEINLSFPFSDSIHKVSNRSRLLNTIKSTIKNKENPIEIFLDFNKNITFQNYISFKSTLSKLELKNVTISKDEFISN